MTFRFYTHERNWGCRITEFVFRGMRAMTLENELLRVSVLVDKGTDIYEFLFKPDDVDFMWRSWQGIRDPRSLVPTVANPTGQFMDSYAGGWQELFPAAGRPSMHKDAHFGQHGEAALLAWDYSVVLDTPEAIAVRFSVRMLRTPFHLEKTLQMERQRPTLFISERVTNEANEPMEFMWGHHPAFGWPFVDQSCVIDLPGARVRTVSNYPTSRLVFPAEADWPHFPSTRGGTVDLSRVPPVTDASTDDAILDELKAGWYALTNRRLGVGFALCWPLDVFRFGVMWTAYGGCSGYPFYGTNYNLALEPWSSIPHRLDLAVAERTALKLGPGESMEAWLEATAFRGRSPVASVERGGQVRFS